MVNKHPSKYLVIISLIIAGEMIFSLPFHIARYFRPTLLDVFNLSNSDLGDVFAVYGITAMLAYFPGGIIADQFSTRKLITLSLIFTAVGGIYMAQFPGITGLTVLFGYWGITSILLFWAPLIRATRDWGGILSQGKAFGLLDGGRGLVAAMFSSLGVIIFTWLIPDNVVNFNDLQRNRGMQDVIYYYSVMTALAGVLIWFIIPENSKARTISKNPLDKITDITGHLTIWLMAIIVVCAYCGYKGLDNYGLYAVQVLGMNEIESSRFTSMTAYIRPVAAIAAGFIADKITSSKLITISFAILIFSYFVLSVSSLDRFPISIIYLNLVVTFIAVFAVRGIYFALIEEFGFPANGTGTAVGIISVVGFTPDIFFTPLAGRILDAAPGIQGHQNYFLLLTTIAICGMAVSISLLRIKNKNMSR